MTPEEFKRVGWHVEERIVGPLKSRLKQLKEQIEGTQRVLKVHERFSTWHQFLTNGITPAGFLGSAETCGLFVRKCRVEPAQHPGSKSKIVEVDLVIVPQVLVAHRLRVKIPHPEKPGTFTNTSMEVDVPGIVERMLEHTGYAQNVSVGTFADVLHGACDSCNGQTVTVALDEYLDEDNGTEFVVGVLCEACASVNEGASFSETAQPNDQYGFTRGIYRKA